MSDLSEMLGQARTRFGKLLLIEKAIQQISPDYLETADILDALLSSLERKYEDVTDIAHEFKQAKEGYCARCHHDRDCHAKG